MQTENNSETENCEKKIVSYNTSTETPKLRIKFKKFWRSCVFKISVHFTGEIKFSLFQHRNKSKVNTILTRT